MGVKLVQFGFEVNDALKLSFSAVLSCHLVLPSSPDVSHQRQLGVGQRVLRQELVKVVYRQIDDLVRGERDLQGLGSALVPVQRR